MCFYSFGAGLVLQALQDVEPPKTIKGPDSSTQQATPSKRKSPPVDGGEEDAEGESDNEDEEGYNTRYKGVKRVKVHGPTPERQEPKPKRKVGRPRKSVLEGGSVVEVRKRGRPRKTISASGEGVIVSKGKGKVLENRNGEDVGDALPSISVSRGRGRPRKKEVPTDHGRAKTPRQSTNTDAPKSKDSGREVFDGIVLVKRNANGKEKAIEEVAVVGDVENGDTGVYGVEVLTGPQDLERDDSEENAVVAVVNGDAQGDLSSLGGSNKGEYLCIEKSSLYN